MGLLCRRLGTKYYAQQEGKKIVNKGVSSLNQQGRERQAYIAGRRAERKGWGQAYITAEDGLPSYCQGWRDWHCSENHLV